MTGWRIGYAGGPEDLVQVMHKLQNQSTGNPNSVAQAAAVSALTGPQDVVKQRTKVFQERRDFMLDRLNNCLGLSCLSPDGAFYVYPSCAGLIGKTSPSGRKIKTDRDFVIYLLEEFGIGAVQARPTGSAHTSAFPSLPLEDLEETCRRIQSACRPYPKSADR